jgi:hypothetical protein
LFLIKKIGKTWCFSIGCVCWIVYQILGIYIINPYGFLGIHILNGFSYGILYNLVLGFVLQKAFKTNKMSPMGVYQGVLSIGITCSYFFTSWLKSEPLRQSDFDQYFWMSDIINWSIIGAIGLSFCVFVFSNRFENKLNILR